MPGQLIAKSPRSPYDNLTAVERIGATKHGSAIWRVECACGYTQQADAPTIKRGAARCPDCNPTYSDLEAQRILSVLPATIDQIVERTSMGLGAVKYRLSLMKPDLCHVVKWRHPRGSGAIQPLIVAGPGVDAPCKLKPRSVAQTSARYRKRVKKAIERADADGRQDERYKRHIARHQADQVAKHSRTVPQTWCSALLQTN